MDVLISSPPYIETELDYGDRPNRAAKIKDNPNFKGRTHWLNNDKTCVRYGNALGQLGAMPAGEPMTATLIDIPTQTWEGCYDDSWKDIIQPASFAHPAKMARGLLCRILDFMLEQGWLTKGSLVLDPFAGIGTTGIECASRGIRFVGVELEPRFVAMARDNFALHERVWRQMGDPLPCVVQGDSRRLGAVLSEAGAVVSSPPFSPPGNQPPNIRGARPIRSRWKEQPENQDNYGTTPGQLGSLPAGSVEAVVSSPPFGDQLASHDNFTAPHDTQKRMATNYDSAYGTTPGQLGSESVDTFWAAAAQILRECHAVLSPGAMTAWVVKDFVRDGQRVPFALDWMKLLVACGFHPLLHVHASLVKTTREASLFGGEVVTTKARKSFFRRLHESKLPADDPRRIDHESVIFAQRT